MFNYTLGAVTIESFDDRMKDYRDQWKELFGALEFQDIDKFEEKYRGFI